MTAAHRSGADASQLIVACLQPAPIAFVIGLGRLGDGPACWRSKLVESMCACSSVSSTECVTVMVEVWASERGGVSIPHLILAIVLTVIGILVYARMSCIVRVVLLSSETGTEQGLSRPTCSHPRVRLLHRTHSTTALPRVVAVPKDGPFGSPLPSNTSSRGGQKDRHSSRRTGLEWSLLTQRSRPDGQGPFA